MLQELFQNNPRNAPTYVLGDSNARLHGCTSDLEQQYIGPYVFGHGAEHVNLLPEEQRDNRQHLVDFCVITDSLVMNTMFPKADRQSALSKIRQQMDSAHHGHPTDLRNLTPCSPREHLETAF